MRHACSTRPTPIPIRTSCQPLLPHAARKAREQAADAEVLCALVDCGLGMVRKGAASAQGRTASDLITALKARYVLGRAAPMAAAAANPGAFCWAAVGDGAATLFHGVSGVGCMMGPMDAEVRDLLRA